MGDRVSKLLRFAALTGGSRRALVARDRDAEQRAQAERSKAIASEDARWVELRATKRFLAKLQAQIEVREDKRVEDYADHLKTIAHLTWDSALKWVIKLTESYKAPR